MPTDLAQYIQATPLCDTHEHLRKEAEYLEAAPDILQSLFGNYMPGDLISAGAGSEAVENLLDKNNPDLRARFEAIEPAWQATKQTGYGQAVRIIARELYGLAELTAAGIEAAQAKQAELVKPGQRLYLLKEKANLDHVQTDDFCWSCLPDQSGPDFFFYDLSWAGFCGGRPDLKALAEETGFEIHNLNTLRQGMAGLFEKYGPTAIAIKAQHAYNRTLRWQKRTDREAALALAAYLHDPDDFSQADRLCLGDWCWARGVELGIEYDLPFKIHTGYYAGNNRMPVDYIRSGHLTPLLAEYLEARFVLMHIAYPYSPELIGLTKHYANVYADLCWAWSIDPYSAVDFVRRFIHAAPANKLFAFGGDTGWPGSALAYAHQARAWLTRALQAEVDDGLLNEAEAIALAGRFMRHNQYDCFRITEKRERMTSDE